MAFLLNLHKNASKEIVKYASQLDAKYRNNMLINGQEIYDYACFMCSFNIKNPLSFKSTYATIYFDNYVLPFFQQSMVSDYRSNFAYLVHSFLAKTIDVKTINTVICKITSLYNINNNNQQHKTIDFFMGKFHWFLAHHYVNHNEEKMAYHHMKLAAIKYKHVNSLYDYAFFNLNGIGLPERDPREWFVALKFMVENYDKYKRAKNYLEAVYEFCREYFYGSYNIVKPDVLYVWNIITQLKKTNNNTNATMAKLDMLLLLIVLENNNRFGATQEYLLGLIENVIRHNVHDAYLVSGQLYDEQIVTLVPPDDNDVDLGNDSDDNNNTSNVNGNINNKDMALVYFRIGHYLKKSIKCSYYYATRLIDFYPNKLLLEGYSILDHLCHIKIKDETKTCRVYYKILATYTMGHYYMTHVNFPKETNLVVTAFKLVKMYCNKWPEFKSCRFYSKSSFRRIYFVKNANKEACRKLYKDAEAADVDKNIIKMPFDKWWSLNQYKLNKRKWFSIHNMPDSLYEY